MKRTVTRIAPWQAAKVFAAIYFVLGLAVGVLLGLISLIVPPAPGEPAPGLGFFLMMPVLYGLGGLIFVPISCWLFNTVARYLGGIEVNVESSDAA